MGCCKEQGVTPAFISIGAAAALHCLVNERGLEQSDENAAVLLEKLSGLEKDSAEFRLILDIYSRVRQGNNTRDLIHHALSLGNKTGVV